jgi:predicted  nucleic acid-binding Zn-ribbon protein
VTTAPKHDPLTSTPASRSIFEDPAISEAAKNDAFVRFVTRHWRLALVTLVVVAGAMIAYNIFTTTAAEKRADATARLSEIQDTYKELVTKQDELTVLRTDQQKAADQKAKDELGSKIDTTTKDVDQLRSKIALMIAALDSPKPFDTLANLYKGLVAGRSRDFERVQAILIGNSWEQAGKPGSPERSIAEVVTLGLAKSLAESDAYRQAAQERLRALAERGSFVAVEAVQALSLLAETPEEKASVATLISAVKKRFPAQEKYLTDATARVA